MSGMVLNDVSVTFIPSTVLKHSRKGRPLNKFGYEAYTNITLHFVHCFKGYIFKLNNIEGILSDLLTVTIEKQF